MKTKAFFLLTLVFAASASIKAQSNIEDAFKRMASDPKVEVSTSIQADCKPGDETKGKTSVCEIHSFAIAKPNKKNRYRYAEYGRTYVENIKNAIQAEASNAQCYRIVSYSPANQATQQARVYNLLYGEDATQYVRIGDKKYRDYVFVCLLDPSNTDYRWCYALEWESYDDLITGRYMKLYAKIPKEPATDVSAHPIIKNLKADPFEQFFLENPDIAAKALKFDSNGSFDGFNIDSINADGAKNIISIYANNFKSENTENFFQRFNALKALWMKGDYTTDTLPVSVYTLVKEALNANILSREEKDFVDMQLADMAEATEVTSAPGKTAAQYIALTQKVLRISKSNNNSNK